MYLSELSWLYSEQLIRFFAVGLCLGTSTVVMVMYYWLVSKGTTDPSERNIMHILYRILRVGMGLAIFTECSSLLYHFHVDNYIYWMDNPELLVRLTIFVVIVLNALAMQFNKISMWLGPVIAGGSWYAYFFFSVWIETESAYGVLVSGYLVFLAVVFVVLSVLRLYLTRHHETRQTSNTAVNAVAQ